MSIQLSGDAVFDVVYKIINRKANSNAFIQGVTGIAGFPATVAADCVALLTHYEPMMNEIRELYGREKITVSPASTLCNCSRMLLCSFFELFPVIKNT